MLQFLFSLVFLASTIFSSMQESPLQVSSYQAQQYPKNQKEFQERFDLDSPIVFKGAAKNWELDHLKFKSLQKDQPKAKITIKNHYNEQFIRAKNTETTLGEFIKNITFSPETSGYLVSVYRTDDTYTYKGVKILDQLFLKNHPDLLKPLCFPALPFQQILFIGPEQTYSKFHQHKAVLSVVIEGQKTFYLIHPDYKENLYLKDGGSDSISSSPIHPEHPDLEKYPLYKDVPVYKITLNERDVIYIPKNWFHFVKAEKSSVLVAAFFEERDLES